MRNALKRNSIQKLEHREPSDGVRWWKESAELTLEQLLEIWMIRVDADGFHRYQERI